MILQDSLNIDKNLTQHEIYLISYKCEHFQQIVMKIYPFSSSKLHKKVNIKTQISKLKNQSSAPQTISGIIYGNSRTCCMPKVFKKFPSGHKVITSLSC